MARGLARDVDGVYIAPQSGRLQHPHADADHYDRVQDGLDAARHRYVAIDQAQDDTDNDQRHNDV